MLPAYDQKHRNDGGELSRQWNTQPARPTTGSPACSNTHIRHERQPQNLQESIAHKKAPRTGAKPRYAAPLTVYETAV